MAGTWPATLVLGGRLSHYLPTHSEPNLPSLSSVASPPPSSPNLILAFLLPSSGRLEQDWVTTCWPGAQAGTRLNCPIFSKQNPHSSPELLPVHLLIQPPLLCPSVSLHGSEGEASARSRVQYKAYTASSWGAPVWIVLSTQLKLGFIFAAVEPESATVSGQQNSAGASKPAFFTQHLPFLISAS